MSRTLVIAEHGGDRLAPSTLATLTAAAELGGTADVLVAGAACGEAAAHAAAIAGVGTVYLAEAAHLSHVMAEDLAPLAARLASGYSHVLAPASGFGKNVLPRLAALLDVQQVSDVVAIRSADTFVRPIHAGDAWVTLRSTDALKLLSIRPTAFDPAMGGAGLAAVERVEVGRPAGCTRFLRESISCSERPELEAARVVVAGGRGLGSRDNFALVEELADTLHAAVGASRAAVDAGYVPNELQIGQTGRVVAPELYIAIGISGAVQHLAGMKESKIIVAINRDPDAPIFEIADYGLVGDLFEQVPRLKAALQVYAGPGERSAESHQQSASMG